MKPPITSFVLIIKYCKNDMVNKKYYFQRSETGQINITHFNYILHKYLIQIKTKYSTKLIDVDHMKPPITSFVLIIKYCKNDNVNKKYYFQRSETGQIYISHFNYILHKYL